MILNEMIDFVRAQCDADPEDAPDVTLRAYAAAAYDDIRRRRSAWPHKYHEDDLVLTPGQATYDLEDIGDGDYERIVSVVSPRYGALQVKSIDELRSVFLDPTRQGPPRFVSVGPASIQLWPTPDAAETFTFTGYKQFEPWPDGAPTDPPDLPREFDMPIAWAMCRDYFMFQEEPEMAVLYDRRFENDTARFSSKLGQTFGAYASPSYFTGNLGRGWDRRF